MQKKILLKIITSKKFNNESSLKIHIGQYILSNNKMDLIIQKLTELGVQNITPLSYNNTSNQQIYKKIIRWKKITISACQQCQRNLLPIINKPITLSSWLKKNNSFGTKIVCTLHAGNHLNNIFVNTKKDICVLIGPEKGFSNDDLILIKKFFFTNVSLGPRILRTETASISVITALQLLYGDLGPCPISV
ncbi:16S rRNA (uracil(1498)-N(3))-methyltransferase [Buchnera aphidicola (Hormaphis cornu)]|nr:16S rRNA (uracil(1498)-N(3))-methyltransferase [Buchnera aphidicola (Hormaphis cornu)]